MTVYQKIRTESWDNETEDVKAEVQRIYDQEHQDQNSLDEEEEENDEEDMDKKALIECQQDCVDIISQVIASFLQDASEAIGWVFYVIGGGMNKEGQIKMVASSVGKTASGSSFQSLHKDWQERIAKPWLDFLHLHHSIEERNHHTMIWAQGTKTVSTSVLWMVMPLPSCHLLPLPTTTETVAPQQMDQMAIMNLTTNPMAVSQLTAAILNPPTATSSPPQMAVLNQVSPAGMVAQSNAAAELAVVNPVVSSPPLMSSVGGQSLSFAHNSANVSKSPDFLNPSFPISLTKAQVGQVIPELSHMYTWENFNVPVLPQPDSLYSTSQQWDYPATPAADVYQNNLANFSYPPMFPDIDHSGSLPLTNEQPSHTLGQVSDTPLAVPTLTSPFATAGLANGAATQSVQSHAAGPANSAVIQLVQSPAANLIATANGAATQSVQSHAANLMDMSNGPTLNLVLNTATNNSPAAVEGSHMENGNDGNKTKKSISLVTWMRILFQVPWSGRGER
ncbi:hypothetical protein AX14_011103 [Amanita brunnescens Koide BX004]|nr:hypothetical protein AX14_011103 [Amanita brunnescens Koide BX004]